jgi:hypothetical protein
MSFFLVLFFYFVPFLPWNAGTESERSFSGRDSHRRLLRQSAAAAAIPGGSAIKPMKIAAINGKPKVSRYLSKECKFLFYFFFRYHCCSVFLCLSGCMLWFFNI